MKTLTTKLSGWFERLVSTHPRLEWEVWLEPIHDLQAVFQHKDDAMQFIVDTLSREHYVACYFDLKQTNTGDQRPMAAK